MTSKLQVKRGGAGAAYTDVTAMTGRRGSPFFDANTPLISMGGRYSDGEASQGTFLLVDPEAEIHSSTYRLPPHGLVLWTEDASGDELWLARNRVAPLQSGRRGKYIGANDVEWDVQTVDCNIDLTGNPFTEHWARPAETDIERLYALHDFVLNGASSTMSLRRRSTDITVASVADGHLVDDSDPVDRAARSYPRGTMARDVIASLAEFAYKEYGVVVHDVAGESHLCLLYIGGLDNDTYQSPVKISQHIADWDPDNPTDPVVEPIWDRGKGTHTDNDAVIDYLVNIWGGTDEVPNVVIAQQDDETDYERWGDTFYDSDSTTEDEATVVAENILAGRRAPGHRTHQLSIKLHADQIHLVRAGMSIQIKSAVVTPAPLSYVWRRITECKYEPCPDGDYFAHIDLDKGLKKRRGSGQPGSTSPKPPPICDPSPAGVPDEAMAADWTTCAEVNRTDPVTSVSAPAWGHIGQQPNGPYGDTGCMTRVDGNEASQYFAVTPSGQVLVTSSLAKIGGPTTAVFTIKFYDVAGAGVGGNLSFNYPSGETHSIPTSHITIWSPISHVFDVPAAAYYAKVITSAHSMVQFLFAGEPVDVVECPPNSVGSDGFPNDPGDTNGDSPYFLPSDSPLLTATDQHIITRLSREMTNASGGDLLRGDVVVAVNQDEFDTISTASYTDGWVGILRNDTEDGAVGIVVWSGVGVVVPNTSDTASVGDFIFTDSTPGEATFNASRSAGALGKVLAVDGAGAPIFIEWWGVPDSGGGGAVATDTIWDAKGDLAAGTGADTAAKLTVGSNDTILMADSSQSTGLKWVASASPSTQAFGDTATTGTADTFTRGDHKHAMPTAAVTTSGLTQATAKILGRTTASTGAIEEISVGGGLTLSAGSLSATGGSAVIATDTLWDAKGDLAAGTGADAASRLAVGSNGLFLKADSTQSTGLIWAAVTGTGGAVGWIQDINESGTSFANFTVNNGTWASNGTIIQETQAPTAAVRAAYHNTQFEIGYPGIAEMEIRLPTTGQGTGTDIKAGFVFGGNTTTSAGGLGVFLNKGTGGGGAGVQVERHTSSLSRKVNTTINLDQWYKLRVVAGRWVSVYLDGALLALNVSNDITAGSINDFLALITFNAIADFRNIKLWTMRDGAPA
jgi:hypothetical protein